MSGSEPKFKGRNMASPSARAPDLFTSKAKEELDAANARKREQLRLAPGQERVSFESEMSLQKIFWEQQASLAQISRAQSSPHHYARSSAQASKSDSQRVTTRSASVASSPSNLHKQLGQGVPGAALAGTGGTGSSLIESVVNVVRQNRYTEHAKTAKQSSRPAPASGGTPSRTAAAAAGNGNNYNTNPQEKKDALEEEKQRQINEDINHQYWTAVDLSGMGLSVLSPRLFEYDFLQKLFLDHNQLRTVPKALQKLPHLKTLDLSSNYITELPSEIGLMHSLRHLLLFDNELSELPYEIGNLFQLDFLGLAGNYFDKQILELMADGGTKAVIQHMRDHAPVGEPPKQRQWQDVEGASSAGQDTLKAPGFSVLTYNTLCDRYATPTLYGYTPSWALAWSYRSQLLVHEVFAYHTDLICLQEVNKESYEDMWLKEFDKRSYTADLLQKSRAKTMNDRQESNAVDGCVTAWKKDVFRKVASHDVYFSSFVLRKLKGFDQSPDLFNRFMSKDNVAMIYIFEHLPTGQPIIVVNTHLHWDPAFGDVKLAQSAFLLEEVERFACKYCQSDSQEGKIFPKLTDLRQLPVVVCGDFNSDKSSGVYQLFSQGSVPPKHPDFKNYQYGRFIEQGISHNLSLKSAYADGVSLGFTNFTPNFVALIDYVWYSTQNLRVISVMSEVDTEYVKKYVGFPNQHHPSDHIPIAAQMIFTRLLK